MDDREYRARVQKIVDILTEDERAERERAAKSAGRVVIAPGVRMPVAKAAGTGPAGKPVLWASDMNDVVGAGKQAAERSVRKRDVDAKVAQLRADLEAELAKLGPYDGGNKARIESRLRELAGK